VRPWFGAGEIDLREVKLGLAPALLFAGGMHRLPVGRTLLLLLLTLAVWWWWSSRPLRYAPGVLVATAPLQEDVPERAFAEVNGFKLTTFARYTLRGRVLGTKRYRSGPSADLVPIDVAVAWGRMSDQAVLDQLNVSMGNRFFFYEWRGTPPLAPNEMQSSGANNHVISANEAVSRAISNLRTGELIEMQGWLVDATGPDHFRWPSSRRRDDTGNGACELLFVETVKPFGVVVAPAMAVVK